MRLLFLIRLVAELSAYQTTVNERSVLIVNDSLKHSFDLSGDHITNASQHNTTSNKPKNLDANTFASSSNGFYNRAAVSPARLLAAVLTLVCDGIQQLVNGLSVSFISYQLPSELQSALIAHSTESG